ncbi:MAG: hypothetical protein VST72_01215 [Nitrospirota bacterium]|nr:hypothetical protein [Nitrospirota bacterium]
MKNRHYPITLLCCMAAFAVILTAGFTAQAQAGTKTTPRITTRTEVHSVAELTDEESQAISIAAGRVLKHTAQAMEALGEEKKDDALKHIDKGLTLLRIIKNAAPHYKVDVEIRSGDITYKDEDEVSQKLVPVFDELDDIEIINPVIQEKKGRKSSATDAPVVTFAGIDYTTMNLNTYVAANMLRRAKKNINDDKTGDAISDLRTIQVDGVVFEFDEVDLPLERAADNLKLAEQELKRKDRHDEARTALNAASDELGKYEKATGDHRSEEVRGLNREIDKLAKQISPEMSATEKEKAASKISGWWNRIIKWFKK